VSDEPQIDPAESDDPELDAPAATADETDGVAQEDPGGAWERPIDKFRRGAVGSVVAAGLLGVRDALEGRPKREEPQIVADAPEPTLDHIDIVLDPEHPERSRAVVYLPPPDAADDDDAGERGGSGPQ
jgi:hypothetical protein